MTYEFADICDGRGRVIRTIETCLHDENVVPVEVGGEVVAYLCTDCDRQLSPRWHP